MGDVVLEFQQHAQRGVDGLFIKREIVELHQGMGPIDGFGDAGLFKQVLGAQFLDEGDDLGA